MGLLDAVRKRGLADTTERTARRIIETSEDAGRRFAGRSEWAARRLARRTERAGRQLAESTEPARHRLAETAGQAGRQLAETSEEAARRVQEAARDANLPVPGTPAPRRRPWLAATLPLAITGAGWLAWVALLYRGRVEARAAALVDRPYEEVQAVFADVDRWPTWQPDIPEAGWLGREQWESGARFRWTIRGVRIVSNVEAAGDGEYIWQQTGWGFRGTTRWEFGREGRGTALAVQTDLKGWAVWLAAPYFQAELNQTVDRWVQALTVRVTGPA